MTRVTFALCTERQKPGGDWKTRMYTWTDSGTEDGVRVHNAMNARLEAAAEEWTGANPDDFIVRGEPHGGGDLELKRLFDIYLDARPSRQKGIPRILVDYKRWPGCPTDTASRMMDCVAMFRKDFGGFKDIPEKQV